MNRFQVRLGRDAEKSYLTLRQSLPAIGKKIEAILDDLAEHPFKGSKLAGADGEVRRIRVGDFRVVYEVFRKEILILVIYVGPRGGAYKH